jgi:ribosome-binding protein aMBF1 (putative translation factor)
VWDPNWLGPTALLAKRQKAKVSSIPVKSPKEGHNMPQVARKKSVQTETELLSQLGEVVRKRRLSLDLSQEELAARAGVHRTYLSDIERGARNITITVLTRLAEALEVRVSRLFRLTEQHTFERPRRR